MKAQIRITNITKGASVKPFKAASVLTIKRSALKDYVEQMRVECNKKYTPNRDKDFDHLPLLCVWDIAGTGEEFFFQTIDDLPKKTVLNSKGNPVLIILPEKERDNITVTKSINK